MNKRRLTDEQRLENKRANGRRQNAKRPYQSRDLQSRLWWAARRRAKARGLPFDISKEDIVIPNVCPYLGINLLEHVPRGNSRRQVASLDRIIPELGYVKGNVEVVSHLANTMKNDASEKELLHFAYHVIEKYRQKVDLQVW